MGKASVVKTLSNREAQYKQQANVAFQLLVLSQKQSEKIDTRELMKYPLVPMPDGYLLKTDKSKEFTYFTKELDHFTMLSNAKTLNAKDRNAIFYCMKEVPATFKQIFQKKYTLSVSWERLISYFALTCRLQEKFYQELGKYNHGSGQKRIIKGESKKRPEN